MNWLASDPTSRCTVQQSLPIPTDKQVTAMRWQDLREFREEVRAFCEDTLPLSTRRKVLQGRFIEKDEHVSWQKLLRAKGWFGGHWPAEYGGLGWSRLQHWVFEQELYRCGSPWIVPFGIAYVGPIIYTFGSAEQQARHLPAILDSDVWWCQGYSEPNAGSDLASLTARATRRGDDYILNGQKTWTTMAQWADMIFVLARTAIGGRPQDGISFLLVDMHAPGVTVRPIESIDRCPHLNDVFFDDVRVPASQLIGAENQGWAYAKHLLANERFSAADVGKSQRMIHHLAAIAQAADPDGGLRGDSSWLRKLAELEVDALALEATCLGFLEAEHEGAQVGPEVSMLKILGSELTQRVAAAAVDAVAPLGLSYQHETLRTGVKEQGLEGMAGVVREYLHSRATTIYGGSNEIQRNIIARATLGL